VSQLLDRACARFGAGDAAIFAADGQSLSWYDLRQRSDDVAAGLLALGIGRGDRVGIWAPNRAEWLAVQFGTAKIGAILVNINPAYQRSELDYALNKVACKVLMTARGVRSSDYVAILRALAPEIDTAGETGLRAALLPHLRHIVERTQLDTHLAILDHGDAVYIERIESPGFIKMATWIGRRMVPHVTGVGKALICCHDRAAVEEIVAIHPLKAITPNTITTIPRLMAELAKTRQRGFAIDDEEHEARVRCVAAPIFAANGEVVAAIGVSGTAGQLSDDTISKIGNLVRSTSLKFSSQLGARRGR